MVTQLDDAGASTDDLYEWQAAMAAADGLALFFGALKDDGTLDPECDDFVLCEWHEDWVLFGRDGTELVSGKHRSADTGAYTTVKTLPQLRMLVLLDSQQNAATRREVVIELTAESRRVVRGVTRRRRAEIGRVVARMSADERRDLVGALTAFTEAGGEPSVTAGDLGWI